MPTKNYSERFYSGTGSPEGVVEAPVGAFYCRTDGAADTTFYKKTSGSAETGWTAITFTGSSGDYTAAQVTNTPAGNIAATDVQTALNELDTEKALLVHTHDAADVATGMLAEARVPQTVTTANGGCGRAGLPRSSLRFLRVVRRRTLPRTSSRRTPSSRRSWRA